MILDVSLEQKKFVFITARIHPGETNASYMMRGVLEFITSDDQVAQVRFVYYENTLLLQDVFN